MAALVLAAARGADDVATFARRAAVLDATSVVRVVGRGDRVGFFVDTPFDALALRAVRLAEPLAEPVDLVVEAVGLAARAATVAPALLLPPPLPALRWSHALPPTSGWTIDAEVALPEAAAAVEQGVADFRARVAAIPEAHRSRAALEAVAADVWGRVLAADVPVRLAHAASSYGFLAAARDESDPGPVRLSSAGSWQRLDAPGGTVLARTADVFSLFAL